jgi:hypothetical protein
MRPVETILRMGGGRYRRMVEGVIYFKNFCKCPNVPTAAIKIINILFFLLM